tara:strand:+ start:148 stop:402 length:255 start_codon:yes stop_codon:yes gene_type:complete
MAYALANPVKKVSQMGDSNNLWYYTDGDATSAIVGSGYFNLSAENFSKNDMILVCATNAGTAESDLLIVTSASGAATVTTTKLA